MCARREFQCVSKTYDLLLRYSSQSVLLVEVNEATVALSFVFDKYYLIID